MLVSTLYQEPVICMLCEAHVELNPPRSGTTSLPVVIGSLDGIPQIVVFCMPPVEAGMRSRFVVLRVSINALLNVHSSFPSSDTLLPT